MTGHDILPADRRLVIALRLASILARVGLYSLVAAAVVWGAIFALWTLLAVVAPVPQPPRAFI